MKKKKQVYKSRDDNDGRLQLSCGVIFHRQQYAVLLLTVVIVFVNNGISAFTAVTHPLVPSNRRLRQQQSLFPSYQRGNLGYIRSTCVSSPFTTITSTTSKNLNYYEKAAHSITNSQFRNFRLSNNVRLNILHHLSLLSSLKSSAAESNDENNQPKSKKNSVLYKLQNLSPLTQLITLIGIYIFHLTVLSQNLIIFPFQLIPNDRGFFQSIGWDSVVGIGSFIAFLWLGRQSKNGSSNTVLGKVPTFFSGVNNWNGTGPWRFKRRTRKKKRPLSDTDEQKDVVEEETETNKSKPKKRKYQSTFKRTPQLTSTVAFLVLVYAYFYTGYLSSMVELGLGFPISIAMDRSLVVLGGHLIWVAIGIIILRTILYPQPFFGGGFQRPLNEYDEFYDETDNNDSDDHTTKTTRSSKKKIKRKYKWYTNQWRSNWLWWTTGGYFFSCWIFNISDVLNQLILPREIFEKAGEGVVSQLINPEYNDLAASMIGYIAPCISAPWWEEVLYRGFLLPALCLKMRFWLAVLMNGIVFSIHHVSATSALPLAFLGWTWSALYAKSGNLMVTILIHAMWNSKVFIGSWLGL